MLKRITLCFAALSLVVASAAASSHNITLFQKTTVNGKQLKPGDYKLEVADNKVEIKSGKKVVAESPVKIETAESKFSSTTVRYDSGDANRIQEIRLGGTNTKLVFNNAGTVAP